MQTGDLGFFMLVVIAAMAISMAITPVMIRLAPMLGMLDQPDNRKVHSNAIPRSGGVGIVIGLLVPVFIWVEADAFTISFCVGCMVLLLFGAWDDISSIRPVYKFIGQVIAALMVVYYGDLYVYRFPLMGLEDLPAYIGKPLTVIAITGMINALNLSDGLDGLAGGEAILSVSAMLYLAYQSESTTGILLAATTIGGIFGFLRFNSHPAKIFMGDAGSQTLGFIMGVLAVYITQRVNPVMSPVVGLLLLGLPIADALLVFYMRAKRGDSLVVAARDHLHHRLLKLGFHHYESVIVIYSMQILLMVLAVSMQYESDISLILIYLLTCGALFTAVYIAEKYEYSVHCNQASRVDVFSKFFTDHYEKILKFANLILKTGLSVFLLSAPLMTELVPLDIGLSAGLMLLLLAFVLISKYSRELIYRLVLFVAIGFSAYLLTVYRPSWLEDQINLVYLFYIVMVIVGFLVVRVDSSEDFQITPLDYLVIIMALAIGMAPDISVGSSSIVWMAIQIIILFYIAEMLIQNMSSLFNNVTAILSVSLIILALRSLL